jgi:hypothetical protein
MEWECENCGVELKSTDEQWNECRFCGSVLCDECYQEHELECEENNEEEEKK